MTLSPRLAIVTGASSGIGAELALDLARRGYGIVAVARREDRLRAVCDRITASGGNCRVLAADLARHDERERVIAALERDAGAVRVLVNNAGFGTHGYFADTDLGRELEMVEVNCAAVLHLSKRVLPWLLQRGSGHVLNVASVASFQPGPLMAVYYASKAFVLSFSEALAEECEPHGVIVSALCPSTIRTEFQAAAGIAASAPPAYATALSASDVARLGLDAMFAGERVYIPGGRNRWAIFLNRVLPRRTIVRGVRRIQEKRLPGRHGQGSELGGNA